MAGEDSPMPEEAMVHVERPIQAGTWICCVPCYWLRRSKAVHKALLTFAMLLVTSLLVTSPVLFLITTLPEGDQPRDCAPLDEACIRERDGQEGVCETRACHEASRRMLAFLKRGVDPCEDFYQFACGGFRDRQPYQPSSNFGSLQAQVDDQIQNMLANASGKMTGAFYKLGQFYETCIDFKDKPVNFTPVYRLLDELGGYLPPKSLAPVDITPLVSELLRLNGAPLFDVYVDVDLYDRTRSSVFLDLPMKYRGDTFFSENQKDDGPRWRRAITLTDEHPRERRSSSTAESRAYTFIKNNMEEKRSQRILKIIDGLLPKKMNDKDKAMETEQLSQFCTALSKIYPRHKDLYNWMDVDQRVYVPYNLSRLQEEFGYIRWKTLLNATLGAATPNSHNKTHNRDLQDQNLLLDDDRFLCVYVTAPHYFHGLGKLLNRFSRRVVHNGLLLLYAADTLHDVVNVTASKNWNVSCSNMAKSMFSFAVGALYVQQYDPQYLDTIANRVEILFERIKETLAERILVKTWLDEETRMQALLKLSALTGKFHVWPGFHNESFVAREMAEVTIDTDDFFSTVMRRFRQIRSVSGEVFRRNASERFRHPYSVNAYYELSTNSIVIPIAMMTAWSWSWDGGPAYAAHATLGSIVGHEILHAFDLHHRGQSLDTDQLLWLTPKTWRRLEARIECVAKLYARSFWRKVKFFGNNVDVQFDWNVTRNENVADIGALQIAHETWQTLTNGKDRTLPGLEALRPNQLFFISAAQTYCSNMTAEAYILSVELDYHTPHPERVNGIMMNSEAFTEAFRCRANVRMNPSEKCSTW
ncbi:neprilysin-1 [Cephus cinctus]|uniref:Neprilysin-1 n=1 Tax=Cephus cinctus TaxID=211228 RepID=A0AAJ7FFJ0_CEPCN|nr:neprilysin-1 [Cephus cinctus]